MKVSTQRLGKLVDRYHYTYMPVRSDFGKLIDGDVYDTFFTGLRKTD